MPCGAIRAVGLVCLFGRELAALQPGATEDDRSGVAVRVPVAAAVTMLSLWMLVVGIFVFKRLRGLGVGAGRSSRV